MEVTLWVSDVLLKSQTAELTRGKTHFQPPGEKQRKGGFKYIQCVSKGDPQSAEITQLIY